MEKSLIEVINKGIPISTPVPIYNSDLLGMTDDKERLSRRLDKEFNKYLDYLCDNYNAMNLEIFKTICIMSDPITLEKRLHFSPDGLISSLLYNLNANKMCTSMTGNIYTNFCISNHFELLAERIDVLRKTTSEKKLAKEFPAIYHKYKGYEEYYKKLKELEKYLNNPNVSKEKKFTALVNFRKIYHSADITFDFTKQLKIANDFSVKYFCNSIADSVENIIENKDDIYEYLETHSLSIGRLGIDPEKLELYIAHQSMKMCEASPKASKQRYIYYVSDYFNSDTSRKNNTRTSIKIGMIKNDSVRIVYDEKAGTIITPQMLYERYKTFLVNNPEIKVINLRNVDFSSMTLEEVEMFMIEYLKDLQSNWELIPSTAIHGGVAHIPNVNPQPLSPALKAAKKKHLEDLYVEKVALYGSTDPFMRVRGKNTFAGYIGHIYSNGKVILDKFFENDKTKRLAYGDAIYIMDIADFYILSHYPKSILKNMPGVQRIEHRNINGISWKDHVLNAIQSGSHQYRTADEVKQLIKTKQVEEQI